MMDTGNPMKDFEEFLHSRHAEASERFETSGDRDDLRESRVYENTVATHQGVLCRPTGTKAVLLEDLNRIINHHVMISRSVSAMSVSERLAHLVIAHQAESIRKSLSARDREAA